MPNDIDDPLRTHAAEGDPQRARIKVIGVGGGGNNAVDRMMEAGIQGVEFICANTDVQALQTSKAPIKLQLGKMLTRGLGTGSDADVGRQAALEDTDRILDLLEGADMVFVTAGLGGGTGTGAAPVIASLASQMGALTIAVVTRPFGFEGKRRMAQAERGVQELLNAVDTLLVMPNEKLLEIAKDAGFFDSFHLVDDVMRQAVQGISDIVTIPGIINRDLADLRTTMAGKGYAVMGTASRSGPKRAVDAAIAAISSPLLEARSIDGARGLLINISGSRSLTLHEVNQALLVIQNAAHEDADIIFGAVLDEQLGDEVKITVIATGFRDERPGRRHEHDRTPVAATSPTIFLEEMRSGQLTNSQQLSFSQPEQANSHSSIPAGADERAQVATLPLTPSVVESQDAAPLEYPAAVDPENMLFETPASSVQQAAIAAYAAVSGAEEKAGPVDNSEEQELESFAGMLQRRQRILDSQNELESPLDVVETASMDSFPVLKSQKEDFAEPRPNLSAAGVTAHSTTTLPNGDMTTGNVRPEHGDQLEPLDNALEVTVETTVNVPSFAGTHDAHSESTELDELDIPAFLRFRI